MLGNHTLHILCVDCTSLATLSETNPKSALLGRERGRGNLDLFIPVMYPSEGNVRMHLICHLAELSTSHVALVF